MGDQTALAPADEPRAFRRSAMRRWSIGLLVAAVLSAAVLLSPHVPHERRIDLRIDEPVTVTGIEVTWFRASDADRGQERIEEPLRGASFRFLPGTAPQNIKHIVQLPDGLYRVDLVVQRGQASESIHRTITLGDADRITLPLR